MNYLNDMKKLVPAVLVLVGVVVFASAWAYHSNIRNSVRWTCDIIHEAYYKKSDRLNEWQKTCHKVSAQIEFGSSKQDAITALNYELSQVGISHLSIYTPAKGTEMWDNAAFKGNLTEAAKALGIGRATLYRKVKQYNIDPSAARKKKAA